MSFVLRTMFSPFPYAAFTTLRTGRAGAHGPPPEMQLSLASLQSPKLGRAPGIVDEPFAWDSREFLRKKCIGKPVCGVYCLVSLPLERLMHELRVCRTLLSNIIVIELYEYDTTVQCATNGVFNRQ